MRRPALLYFLVPLFAAAQVGVESAQSSPPPGSPGVRVVLIGGINKDPEEIRSKDRNMMRLARYFRETVGVPAPDLYVLTQKDSFVSDRTDDSDTATITRVLTDLAQKKFEGTTIVYYTGQANLVGDQLRFNVPGPDLTHNEFAAMIAAFGAAPICIVLDCPGAGLAAKALAAPNRIVVFAARSDQPTSTRFSDYFVPALEDTSADVNGDGRISVVEAFQTSVQQIDSTFRDQSLLKSETALLDDNGDGIPSQHPWVSGQDEKDGRLADGVFTDTWDMVYSLTQHSETEVPPSDTEGKRE